MRRSILASALGLCLGIPGIAAADPITAFTFFGGNNASIGSNNAVNSGLIGSNGGMTINGGTTTMTVMGAGVFSGGSNLNVSAAGDVIFNGDVTISGGGHITGDIDSGGNVSIGSNTIVDGSIRAAGKVTLNGGVHVKGDVDAGLASGQAVSLGSSADVDGTITRKAGTTTGYAGSATFGASVTGTPDAPAPYAPTLLPGQTVFLAGATSHTLGGGSTLTLAPGSFNDINLGSNSTLNLSAGSYYFDTWTLNGGIDINFDLTLGDVLLFFTGDVNIGSNAQMHLIGGDASDIYAETYGDWTLNGGGDWFGTIYGSGAQSDISFGSNSNLTGALWATHNLVINGGGQANYVMADRFAPPTPPTAVPEPATLVLAAAGLVGAAVRRRRK